MNEAPAIDQIDAGRLTGPVRQYLSSETAVITTWEHQPVSYIKTETANLGLHRFRGSAADQGQTRSWSIMLKAVHAPANDADPAFWNYHRREILAYQTGLLADLPGGLLAPRCLDVTEFSGDIFWLWLEDVVDDAGANWSLADYSLAARALGRFNGSFGAGQPLPAAPWLSRSWLPGWIADNDRNCQAVLNLCHDPVFWTQPALAGAFDRPVAGEVRRLWASHELLLAALDQLPRTFCHRDAYRPNLFIRQKADDDYQLIAVDWVFAGIGAVGEDIANLLAASLIWFEHDAYAAPDLDEAIFSGYLMGLREADWSGDLRLARFGFTASCALRWGVVGLWWLQALTGDRAAEFEQQWRRPLPELVSQWARTSAYMLDLASEAYWLRSLSSRSN